jgi:hypothetical protein
MLRAGEQFTSMSQGRYSESSSTCRLIIIRQTNWGARAHIKPEQLEPGCDFRYIGNFCDEDRYCGCQDPANSLPKSSRVDAPFFQNRPNSAHELLALAAGDSRNSGRSFF